VLERNAETMGQSMQTGLGLPGTSARAGCRGRFSGSIAVLVLGLALSACAGTGQLASLGETARPAIAIESIEGAPAAVVPSFVAMLKEEAEQRQIALGSPGEVNYRLRGYLAARDAERKAANAEPGYRTDMTSPLTTTSVAWTLDVYDGDQHRVVRLSGEEKAANRRAADDQVLRRAARAGMDQLAAFLATTRAPSAGAAVVPQRTAWGSGWLDDWTPEASGIFRLFGREPSKAASEARVQSSADDTPLPRGRPGPAGVASVTGDRAESGR
jgi:hypothetical protein